MKHAAGILEILIVVFIGGCQDNNMTGPTDASPSKQVQLSKDEPVHSLALDAILHEPGNVYNSFVQINGSVVYQATVVPLDPIPPNPQYMVMLDLDVNAEFRPLTVPPSQPQWHVSGISNDWLPIPTSGSAFVTKRFQIEGRSDGMLLKLKFEVTLSGVVLNSLWLELPRIRVAENLD